MSQLAEGEGHQDVDPLSPSNAQRGSSLAEPPRNAIPERSTQAHSRAETVKNKFVFNMTAIECGEILNSKKTFPSFLHLPSLRASNPQGCPPPRGDRVSIWILHLKPSSVFVSRL